MKRLICPAFRVRPSWGCPPGWEPEEPEREERVALHPRPGRPGLVRPVQAVTQPGPRGWPTTLWPEPPGPDPPDRSWPVRPEPERPGTSWPVRLEPERPGTTWKERPGPGRPGTTWKERPGPGRPGTTWKERPGPGRPGTTWKERPGPGRPGTSWKERPGPGRPDRSWTERPGPGRPDSSWWERPGPGRPDSSCREPGARATASTVLARMPKWPPGPRRSHRSDERSSLMRSPLMLHHLNHLIEVATQLRPRLVCSNIHGCQLRTLGALRISSRINRLLVAVQR